METGERLFLGIDVGTGGVRAMAVDGNRDEVAAVASRGLRARRCSRAQQGRHEQPPQAWWRAVCQATADLVEQLVDAVPRCPAAARGRRRRWHLGHAGRAGQGRGAAAAGADVQRPARGRRSRDAMNDAAGEFCDRLGYRFNARSPWPRSPGCGQHEPAVFDRGGPIRSPEPTTWSNDSPASRR